MFEFIGTARAEIGRNGKTPQGSRHHAPQATSAPTAAVPGSWIVFLLVLVMAGCAIVAPCQRVTK